MTLLQQIDPRTLADAAAFHEQVVEPCRPVLLRGACREWPLTRMSGPALLDELLRFDGGRPAEVFVGEPEIAGRYTYGERPDGFNFAREAMPLRTAFDRIAHAASQANLPSVYAGSLPADMFFPGFAAAYPMAWLPGGVGPRIWIGNASHVACHYDTMDNLACCVAGDRQFTLYPPDAIADLYVGPIDHTMAGQPVSLAAEGEWDATRHPRFTKARERAITVTLAPGDALYLPKLWWHQVRATAPINCLVNYWWDGAAAGPDAPMTAMMLAMIAIAERPAVEREAWRAWFDHYVFRPNGHPLAHLPSERHGVLGPLGQGNYGRIRAMVMQLLRR